MQLKSKKRALVGLAATIPALALPVSAGATTLVGSGSSAAQPYVQQLFRSYNKLHHKIHFKYLPDGGNAGVQDVQSGRSQFAIQTRPPLASDAGTTYVKLFLDGLCLAVNPSNSLSNVSLTQAKAMFTAVDTNWTQVQGSNLNTTIDPVGRNSAAGTYTFFQTAVLSGATQASNVQQQTSDGLVAVAVGHDRSAIGYVGLAHSGKGSGVKKLTIGGVPCDDAHIKNESYPLFRYIWGVFPTVKANTQVEKFFDWVSSNKSAGKVISKAGAVPAFNRH
jgi:phosphate transport system substrate-binding protein